MIEAGDAPHIGQRRHVHDRHAGYPGLGDGIQQLAHAGRAVLRLLHGQPDQVVIAGLHASGAARGDLASQFARIDLDRILAAADRHAHAEALGVDQVGLGRQADQVHRMASEQHLGGEQRPVRRAHDHDLVRHFHSLAISGDCRGNFGSRQRAGDLLILSAHSVAQLIWRRK
jgi:hypothetical protein